MAELKDSGARRDFGTGAVRDASDGKGRCDLLPLVAVAQFLGDGTSVDGVLCCIGHYFIKGNTDHLLGAINEFRNSRLKMDRPTLVLEVSKQFEDGSKKYGERNWEKGIPLHCFIDSGIRHYLKFLRGDTDEPHDLAFVWNMLCAVWTHKNKPEMIDLPFARKDE